MKYPFNNTLPHADPLWVEHGYGTRFQGFQNLMRNRIRDILLVSSLYDLYVFEEDGRLYELIRSQYQDLNLSHAPELTRVANGKEAISLLKEERRFDLILTTLHIEDMRPAAFAKRLKEEGIDLPVILLAFDNKELSDLLHYQEASVFDQIFIWQGDFRLLLAIIKHLEDKLNVEHDTRMVGVQSIIVIENDIRYYSGYLPIVYIELMKYTQRLISEGINLSHKQLRQRARPKILFCTHYEEAWDYFIKYQDTVLGILSDVDFPRNGKPDPEAGFVFAQSARKIQPDVPVLLHSSHDSNATRAKALDCEFLLKQSVTSIEKLRQFLVEQLSFGDFIFRGPDGSEVGRAHDLLSLEKQLKYMPEDSILYHAERNHFSTWLKARTEFWLAHQLRPRKVSDFPSTAEMRDNLIASLREYRKLRQRGIVTRFDSNSFDPYTSLSKIGGGQLGGKARGLSFVNMLINNYNVQNRFEGIRIFIPPAVVLGTDVFDRFMDENNLRDFVLSASDDEIIRRFSDAPRFPKDILRELKKFLRFVNTPLAVRSSSLMEDSHNHPFAGVYKTFMLPNGDPDPKTRLNELVHAIKMVFASTYLRSAKDYIRATAFRLDEEKMAVIVQKMLGATHGRRFYPDFSGVARSYNYYPIPPQKFSDGIASMAMGLGKMVVECGSNIRFSPKYPQQLDQYASLKTVLQNAQRDFFAIDLDGNPKPDGSSADPFVKSYPVSSAEDDGVLDAIASTYSPENNTLTDGTSRQGVRIITFSPIIKNRLFPLSEILELLLDMGGWGMGTPVEIEFAVNLHPDKGEPTEFGLLQMRPMVLNRELEVLHIEDDHPERLICLSSQVLGNGSIENIRDVVMVDPARFDRSKTRDMAQEISQLNSKLLSENRPYLLIGMGRWGSLDPWLGIPVTWSQISGARAIIETGFEDLAVEPSQGSHFFQNLNSFFVGYFTVLSGSPNGFIDWAWLTKQPVRERLDHILWIRFESPVVIKMSGHLNKGVIFKPGGGVATS